MTKNIFAIAAGLLVMSSCGVMKNYERPADIKTDGIYGDAQTGDSVSMGDLPWREVFTDPQLQSLIEKALVQNTNVKNTALQLKEVEYSLKASKLAFVPSLYFTPEGSISKIYDSYNRSQYKSATSGNSKTYSLPMTFGWQSVNFLELRNAKKSSQISVEQMKNAQQSVQAQLVASIASLYYNICSMDEQLEMLKATEQNWAIYLDMQRKLMDAGQANIAAVASIEATYLSIQSSVVNVENNIRLSENSLATLLGESSQTFSRGRLEGFHAPTVMATGLPIRILARRPDVRDAEYTLAKAFYNVNQAKAAMWPSLTLTATGQYTNSVGSSIINPGMMIGNALASLSQPIFANGRLRAQLKINKAEYEIAANNFQQTVIEAGNEVNTASVELYNAESQRVLLEQQVKALEQALDATQKLYTYGDTNYLNVITAQNSLISAKTELITNRLDAINATIDLYQALGGGTD